MRIKKSYYCHFCRCPSCPSHQSGWKRQILSIRKKKKEKPSKMEYALNLKKYSQPTVGEMEVEFNFHLVKPAKCKYKDRLWINTLKIKGPLARQIVRSISLTSLSRDGVEKTGKAVVLYGLAIMLYSRC